MTDKNFYPERGEMAWPDGCPCCGSSVREFEKETDDEFPMWVFECSCEIILEDGNVWVNEDCPDAMDQHIEGIVTHSSEPS